VIELKVKKGVRSASVSQKQKAQSHFEIEPFSPRVWREALNEARGGRFYRKVLINRRL
jgi:hypothetical protein